jgi:type I restriction enzyme R subunit
VHYTLNESQTRYNLIDPLIEKAGWNLNDRTQVGFEIPIDGYEVAAVNGITDYVLLRENGEVLAVVEAKRTKRDAKVAKEQVYKYILAIEKKQSFRPFAFMTNGEEIYFWDTLSYPERLVAGFSTREDLNRLLYLQQNKLPLSSVKIKENITNRSYQAEAIRRICENVEQTKKRKSLLVMATGTGKTRTTMSLIDVFIRARQAQRVLFLADRDSLVDQALNDGFKEFLPDEARERIRTYTLDDPQESNKIKAARVLVSTLQTLELCYDKFSPGYFDLIVSDECHRSIYNKFSDVLAYFDAVQIGLTATPANFIDRDTFRFFDCTNNVPTFLYTYEQAVKDGYLADFNVYSAQTKFQRKGIKGIDLSEEEQNQLRERGIDPENINFEGTDLERKVTNTDTLYRQWEEFMDMCHKDASGQLPAKTIVFAVTHDHAMRLEKAFSDMYPEHRGLLARVIDSKTERAKDLLRQFKKENFPRIAISVDMLDTGVDVPEVMNLAFMKPVGSQIKFWQMIGRGTRSFEACKNLAWLPNQTKDNFLIIDYWENFEHYNMMKKEEQQSGQVPVLVTIFNTRLSKLELLLNAKGEEYAQVVADLRADVARIPLESFTVKKELKNIRDVFEDEFWSFITPQKIELLRLKVAPLLRFVAGINLAEAFFTSKMERFSLQLLQAKANNTTPDVTALLQSITEDVALLPTNLPQVAPQKALIEKITSGEFWQKATHTHLTTARQTLAPLMRYKRERKTEPFELGLDDVIEARKWVIVKKGSYKLMVEEYKKRVEEKVEQLAQQHPTIVKLKEGKQVSWEELAHLEETLETELCNEELNLDEDNMLKAFGVRVGSLVDFLKHLLQLEHLPTYEEIVRRAFDAFIMEHNYNADQTKFLRTVQNVFLEKRKIEPADLYEAPFNNFGLNAVERLFSEEDIKELMDLTKKLVA